mgnify:CR=1 FL=1
MMCDQWQGINKRIWRNRNVDFARFEFKRFGYGFGKGCGAQFDRIQINQQMLTHGIGNEDNIRNFVTRNFGKARQFTTKRIERAAQRVAHFAGAQRHGTRQLHVQRRARHGAARLGGRPLG